jgi:hypothetical protein
VRTRELAEDKAVPAQEAPARAVLTPLPSRADAATVLQLQRTIGNAAVGRALARQEAATAPEQGMGLGPAILAGTYDNAVYKADLTGFDDAQLDAELQRQGERIGVDTTLRPGTAIEPAGGASGGDSGGKPVEAHPPWVERFQDHLSSPAAQQAIAGKPKTTEWSEEDQVAQRLLRIFLTRWTEQAQGFVAPSVAELYENVGAFESNRATNDYGVGVSGAKDWCAQASSTALAEAMLKSGLRFNRPPPNRMKKRRYGVTRMTEVALQAELYNQWVQTTGRKLGGVMGAEGARGATLLPGDILSFFHKKHGPDSTGHVVTVVRALQHPTVQVASGNAAGEAVRMEEIVVSDPPPGFSSQDKRRPPGDKDVWIFSLVRASWLNAFVLYVNSGNQVPEDMLDQFGLEHCDRLDDMYDASGKPKPEPGAAEADPYAGL